jgi:hypothetical protein
VGLAVVWVVLTAVSGGCGSSNSKHLSGGEQRKQTEGTTAVDTPHPHQPFSIYFFLLHGFY